MLRIAGGTLRGRRIAAPKGLGTRPTAEKVRQAIFNVLRKHLTVEGASVLDLYAGSGALGIEALSRGAARAVFVEADARAAEVLRANLRSLDLAAQPGQEARAQVVQQRVLPWLARAAVEHTALEPPAALVLLDPPYASGELQRVLPALAAWPGVAAGAILVVETSARGAAGDFTPPPGLAVLQSKRYGDTQIVFLIKGNAPPSSHPDPA
jgi:16S rRNA (guanine966-N2)-methyltransferase